MKKQTIKKSINQRVIDALKPAPKGKRYDVRDTVLPGFGVRVTDTGAKTYTLTARFPGDSNPTRRAIGDAKTMAPDIARQTARDWLGSIARDIDPKNLPKKTAAPVADSNPLPGAITAPGTPPVATELYIDAVEEWIAEVVMAKNDETGEHDKRSRYDITRCIRNEFGGRKGGKGVGPLKDAVLAEIETKLIGDLVRAKARGGAKGQARLMLAYVKPFFRWCVTIGKLKHSPTALMSASSIGLKANPRVRMLDNSELRALWHEVQKLPYPFKQIYTLLIKYGLRLNEVVRVSRSEIDFKTGVWTIPPARMKNKLGHSIPLAPDDLAMMAAIPLWNAGDFMFTTTGGRTPIWIGDKVKKDLDAKLGFAKTWRNHDLRRTMRTNLDDLDIEDHVREAMLSHKRPGIKGVYNVHKYLPQKQAAYALWHAMLKKIVGPQLKMVG